MVILGIGRTFPFKIKMEALLAASHSGMQARFVNDIDATLFYPQQLILRAGGKRGRAIADWSYEIPKTDARAVRNKLEKIAPRTIRFAVAASLFSSRRFTGNAHFTYPKRARYANNEMPML